MGDTEMPMPAKLPYQDIAPSVETPRQTAGWLRNVIWGTQVPQLVAGAPPPEDWLRMDLQGLAHALGPSVQANMMVSPTGVVGYYNTGLVQVALRDGRVWGRSSVARLLPHEEIELPHVQIMGNLGGYAEFFRTRTPEACFVAPTERVYLRTCDTILPHVRALVAPGIPTEDGTLENLSVYLSQAGTVTNLHWDAHSGAIQQLRGRKRVVLFAPSEMQHLPMYPNDHIFARRSRIDGRLDAAALEAFPTLAQARGFVCDVRAGEWLYIPAGWMHYVETCDDDCISLIINFFR